MFLLLCMRSTIYSVQRKCSAHYWIVPGLCLYISLFTAALCRTGILAVQRFVMQLSVRGRKWRQLSDSTRTVLTLVHCPKHEKILMNVNYTALYNWHIPLYIKYCSLNIKVHTSSQGKHALGAWTATHTLSILMTRQDVGACFDCHLFLLGINTCQY